MSLQAIIIGSSHAGANVAYNLRKDGFNGKIDIFTKEKIFPYHRPPLSKDFLKNHTPLDKLFFKPEKFYAENQINIHTQSEVDSINPENKYINVSGSQFSYDSLVLATGSSPRKLNLENSEADNILYLRDISDAEKIKTYIEAVEHITLIGGGYIGLEVAAAIIESGKMVTILELEDRILKRVTSEEISNFYHNYHSKKGVDIRCGTGLETIQMEGNKMISVRLTNTETLKTDCLIVGIGAIPNVDLAEAAGIKCNNGIVVDQFCRTSNPHVLAAGDCTFHFNTLLQQNLRLESVPNALAQSKVVSSSILGNDLEYSDFPWFWSDQYDLKLQMAGLSHGFDECFIYGDLNNANFIACYGKNDTLISVDSVNSSKGFMLFKKALSNGHRISMSLIKDKSFSPENIFSGTS